MSRIHTERNCCLSSQAAKILHLIPCTKIQRWPFGIPAALKAGQGAKESPFHVLLGPLRRKEKKNCLPCKYNEVTLWLMSPDCRGTVTQSKQVQTGLSFYTLNAVENCIQEPDLSAQQKATNGNEKINATYFWTYSLNSLF